MLANDLPRGCASARCVRLYLYQRLFRWTGMRLFWSWGVRSESVDWANYDKGAKLWNSEGIFRLSIFHKEVSQPPHVSPWKWKDKRRYTCKTWLWSYPSTGKKNETDYQILVTVSDGFNSVVVPFARIFQTLPKLLFRKAFAKLRAFPSASALLCVSW